MKTEKLGSFAIETEFLADTKDFEKQIKAALDSHKDDVIGIEVRAETDKLKKDLEEIKKSILDLTLSAKEGFTNVGNSLDELLKTSKQLKTQYNQIANTINQKLENSTGGFKESLEEMSRVMNKMGTDYSSLMEKMSTVPTGGTTAFEHIEKGVKSATEEIADCEKHIASLEKALKLLNSAKSDTAKTVANNKDKAPFEILGEYRKIASSIKAPEFQVELNKALASDSTEEAEINRLAQAYGKLSSARQLASLYIEKGGIQNLGTLPSMKSWDELDSKASQSFLNIQNEIQNNQDRIKQLSEQTTKATLSSTEKAIQSEQKLQSESRETVSAAVANEAEKKAAVEATTNTINNQQNEIAALDALKTKLTEVTNAIEEKTAAFIIEGTAVDDTVQGEIAKLNELEKKVREIIDILAGVKHSQPDSIGAASDQNVITQELENLRSQFMDMDSFRIPLLPEINTADWVKEINLQIKQLNSQDLKIPQSGTGDTGKKKDDSIQQKTAAYERLIQTEARYQQLQYDQSFGGGLTKREVKELNKLTSARASDVALIKKSSANVEEHTRLEAEWLNTQKQVTDAIFQNADALEAQKAKAEATKKALDGYKSLANTEQKFQELLSKRGGSDVQGGSDTNLSSQELKTFLNIEQARLAAIKNISSAKSVGIDLSESELKYEEQRVFVAEKLARIEAANNSRSKLDPVVNAYQTLLITEEKFQVLEQKRKGADANLPAGELRKYLELSEIRRQAINEISAVTARTEEQNRAEADYNAYAQKTIDTISRLNSAEQQRLQKKHGNYLFDASDMDTAKSKIENHIKSIGATMKGSLDWSQSLNGYIVSLERGDGIIEKTKFHLEETKDGAFQVYKTIAQTTKATSSWEKIVSQIGNRFKALGAYLASFVSVYQIWGQFKQGLKIVRDLDTQLTEMLKVSDESVASLKRYQKETFNVAKEVGSTASVIQSSTADYMRLGKTLSEASELAKNTSILMNVSEFQNINDATESMIAMTQAYKDLSSLEIIDKLNLAGNNFSISTSDLAQSLQQSAAALKVAGNDINEAIALTIGANSILQDPLSAGKGVRTISLRLMGTDAAKKELEELGEDVTDFEVTTTSKLAELIENLTSVGGKKGVSILEDNGNYKSTYKTLLEIAKVWKQIKEEDKVSGLNRQEALLEKMAGEFFAWICGNTCQRTYLIARTA